MASSNIDELQIQIDFLATKTKGLDDAVTKLTEISEVINKMKTNNLKHLSNILDRLAVSSKKASKASETLKQIQESVKANGGTIGYANLNGGDIQTDGMDNLKRKTDDATKSVKKLNTSTSKLKKLLDSVGRVALYRAIRSILKAITETISTGIEDAYQWSKTMTGADNSFAQFMDGLKSSTTYLSNSFGALAMTISNALGSSIENIIDGIADLINNISALAAALTGQSYYYKAIKTQQEYAKAVTDTAKALAGFDELNNIGKSSSSTGTSAFTNAFEKADLPDWAQTIADYKEEIGLVALLAAAYKLLKDPLSKIAGLFKDKNGLLDDQSGLTGIETGLVGALAGAFVLSLIPALGDVKGAFEKVNEWINTVSDSIKDFVESIPANLDLAWQYVQDWVTDIVNTKVEIFGWETTIGGILETLGFAIGLFTGSSWDEVYDWVTDIGDTEVDFNGWKTTVGNIFDGLMNTIKVLTGNGFSVAFNNIFSFLTNSDYDISAWVNDVIKKVGSFATNFANGISKGLTSAWNNLSSWCSQVGNGLSSWFNTLGSKISQWWQNLWNGSLLQGIVNGVGGLFRSWNATSLGSLTSILGVSLGLSLKRFLPSYDVGTGYVPHDMVAQIHEGEAIIPKKFNNAEFFSEMGNEDSEETNTLLRELISVVRNKDYTISTTDIGKSAVKYINTKSRELGGSLI